MPPTEHQQICGRHGCNWKLESAALWYEAPLRELQEGIGKKKNQKREVGWFPELLTTVPGRLGGHWEESMCHMPDTSCRQTSSPAMYVACTYRLSFSIRKSVLDKRERKQLSEWSCWSWLGRAELSGEGLLPTPGWHCSAILALAALLSAQLGCGGHPKGFPKHHQHPREKPLEQKPRAYPR